MSQLTAQSREEIETRHKKEIKALDGEKRAALKKAKALKGKKGKDAQASLEIDYEEKTKEMQQRHIRELSELQQQNTGSSTAEEANDGPKVTFAQQEHQQKDKATTVTAETTSTASSEEAERQRKQEKARRKREKQKEKQRRREEEIVAETAAAGPTPRDLETLQLMKVLEPFQLTIRDVPADGHCLYRAVAAQTLSSDSNNDDSGGGGSAQTAYAQIRAMCATTLEQHSDEFVPFCEFTEDIPDFNTYVERVRSSADWGGHLELRALATALQRPIYVYSANQASPMVIGEEQEGAGKDPILLSYHLHYYSLGEHYNQVVPVLNAEE